MICVTFRGEDAHSGFYGVVEFQGGVGVEAVGMGWVGLGWVGWAGLGWW